MKQKAYKCHQKKYIKGKGLSRKEQERLTNVILGKD